MVASHRARGRRPVAFWVALGVTAVLLFCAGWVVVRALLARDELLGALPIAETVRAAVIDGDTSSIGDNIDELRDRAEAAASLTSDPIWRAAELLPVLGSNLTAFRQSAALVEGVADDALPALGELADTFTVGSFSPKDGAFDLEPFEEAAPLLATADEALVRAAAEAEAIDTSATVSQVGEAVDQLVALVGETQSLVSSLDTAVELFSPMLGADGPRSYLLLSLNNAELRATGGIPGAVAVVTADGGRLALGDTASASEMGLFPTPVLEPTETERLLYSQNIARFMQDVNFTPDFARTGELARAMWSQYTGQAVDGVIAIDPVALGYLLSAIGPVDAGSGITLNAENASSVLLSDVYATFPEPKDQDAFFVGVTKSIFSALTSGGFDQQALLSSLTRAADERRIHLWSSDAAEQALLAPSTLSGSLPASTADESAFGVYFNDGTGAKMDYYLRAGVTVSTGLCGPSAQPNFGIEVRLSSTAPLDAATALPEYVTGGGAFGVAPGAIMTNVYVYAPEGTRPYTVTVDGVKTGFTTTEHDGHTVVALRLQLSPGQTASLDFRLLGQGGAPVAVALEHTPMAFDVPTSLDNFLDCPVPPTGSSSQS